MGRPIRTVHRGASPRVPMEEPAQNKRQTGPLQVSSFHKNHRPVETNKRQKSWNP